MINDMIKEKCQCQRDIQYLPVAPAVFWLGNDISENSSPSFNVWPALDAKHVFPKNLGKQRYWTGVWMLRAAERCSDESLFWLGLAQIELQMQNQHFYFLNDHVTALNMVEWWTYRCGQQPLNQTLRVALHDYSLNVHLWTRNSITHKPVSDKQFMLL